MRKIFFLVILITVTQLVTAQKAGETRFSLNLSPQISWVKSDLPTIENKDSKLGYNFGVVIDRFFGDNYAFSTGLTINTTGGKLAYPQIIIDGEETVAAVNQSYKLKYLEVPLGLKLRSEDMHRTNIYGRFGLSPQINIQAKDDDNNKLEKEVRLFELSYHLGAGIEYSLGGRNAIVLGLIYNNGFTDISKNNDFDDKAILNRLIFEFGFIF